MGERLGRKSLWWWRRRNKYGNLVLSYLNQILLNSLVLIILLQIHEIKVIDICFRECYLKLRKASGALQKGD